MATDSCDQMMDPETQFLMEIRLKSKRRSTSNNNNNNNGVQVEVEVEVEDVDEDEQVEVEWDKYKENVRPLKRGRNVNILNQSLKSNSVHSIKNSLLLTRRKLIEAIDSYTGDDPLHPWLQCIKWVQEAFPAGGDSSGLVVLYEHCVRTFWHDDCYNNDLRYLKVWLEYAENCADAEVIYRFLDANKIGQSHSVYYIAYALHMESKHKIKTANDIFNQGLSMNAQPHEKLEAAYRKFIARSMRRPKTTTEEDLGDHNQPSRSFGTVLSRGENRKHELEISDLGKKKGNGGQRGPLSVYKDANVDQSSGYQVALSKAGSKPWDTLPTHKERNKENKAIPAKWTSYKIPQRPGRSLGGGTTTTHGIDVFVDEECSELQKARDEARNASNLQLKDRDEHDIRRETELLRENPLRHFPTSSFPR